LDEFGGRLFRESTCPPGWTFLRKSRMNPPISLDLVSARVHPTFLDRRRIASTLAGRKRDTSPANIAPTFAAHPRAKRRPEFACKHCRTGVSCLQSPLTVFTPGEDDGVWADIDLLAAAAGRRDC